MTHQEFKARFLPCHKKMFITSLFDILEMNTMQKIWYKTPI